MLTVMAPLEPVSCSDMNAAASSSMADAEEEVALASSTKDAAALKANSMKRAEKRKERELKKAEKAAKRQKIEEVREYDSQTKRADRTDGHRSEESKEICQLYVSLRSSQTSKLSTEA